MIHLLMSETTEFTKVEQSFFSALGGVPESFAYIPSRTDSERRYFSKYQKHFVGLGVKNFTYCDFDQEFSQKSWDILESSSAIYLSGGFTPSFLETLQKRNVLPLLIGMAKTKPLIGVSAGALIMGKDISILNEDPHEGPATKNLQNLSGLGLYSFEFWPHFGRKSGDAEYLKHRSEKNKNVILSCDDFGGVIIDDKNIRCVGDAHTFESGSYKIKKHSF